MIFDTNHAYAANRTVVTIPIDDDIDEDTQICGTTVRLVGTILLITVRSGNYVIHDLEFQKLDVVNLSTGEKIGHVRANVNDLSVNSDSTVRVFQANGLITCIGSGKSLTPTHIGITYENGNFTT